MDQYDLKLFRRRMNGIANILIGVALVCATGLGIVAIIKQGWPWWADGFAFCGIVLAWSFVFYGISKSPFDAD